MKISRRPIAAAVAVGTVAWLGLAATPAMAASDEGALSSAWLSAQVQSDGLLHGAYGGDHGLTIDGMLSLHEIGGNATVVNALADALAANPQAYISGEAWGDTGSTYAGATGKLTTALDAVGRDVTSVSGVNLVDRLESVIVTTGADTGRGMDVSAWGDYSNGVGQTWVTRGLVAVNSGLADDAVEYLLAQQCGDGGFRTNLNDTGCTSNIDTTAYALVTLLEARDAGVAGTTTASLTPAITAAVAKLTGAQAADGSFGADDGINSNSTGLAGWALFHAGENTAGNKAASWIRENTYVRNSGPLVAEKGAIAFNAAARSTAVAAGSIHADDRAQWVRAAAQAAAVWAGAANRESLYDADITVSPTVTAGTSFPIAATGFEPGETVIVDLSMVGAPGGVGFAGFKFAVLDTVTANGQGAIALTATAPATPGDYVLTTSGTTASGATPVTVAAAGGDGDGDGDGGSDGSDDSDVDAGADASDDDLPDSGSSVNPGLLAGALALVAAGAGALVLARRRSA